MKKIIVRKKVIIIFLNYLQKVALIELVIVSPLTQAYDLLAPPLSTHHESGKVFDEPLVAPSLLLKVTATAQLREEL